MSLFTVVTIEKWTAYVSTGIGDARNIAILERPREFEIADDAWAALASAWGAVVQAALVRGAP